ncbi:hypothetical protein DYB35_004440 [Aphanomyces astaci]|uniref:START domain-containing protein n=1 Tax=Aphanomyces astaci TaxID=112090 RepID=A0A418CKI4_APHAT|nr:hypothetical protein DYB35_004440 [Aphanomyces astaci]
MHARMRGAKLPLPVDFTPPNADTTAQWKRLAVHTKDQLVKLSRLRGGRVRWTRYSDKHGVQVYRGADEEAPPGLHTWCAVTEVQATIDEVDNLFRSDASRSVGFIESAQLFDRNVLDATIVHTLEDTPAASLGVQWLLTRPMGTFSSLRDWCLLTVQTH